MTTAQSPLSQLKAQADRVAQTIKAVGRGETVADPGGKIAAARLQPSITFAVVMDDKTLKIEMTWSTIRTTSEVALAEVILKYMRGNRDAVH